MKREYIMAAVIGLVLFLLGLSVGSCSGDHAGRHSVEIVRVKHDTTVRLVAAAPIVIHDAPVRVRSRRGAAPVVWIDSTDTRSPPDTIGIVKPFEAKSDTIVGRDTIHTEFTFPPPRQSVVVRQGPDSVITHTITVTQESIRETPFIEKVGWCSLGALIGAGVVLILGGR